jgi:hypothetical protein
LIAGICFKHDYVQPGIGEGYRRSATNRPAADDNGIAYSPVH